MRIRSLRIVLNSKLVSALWWNRWQIVKSPWLFTKVEWQLTKGSGSGSCWNWEYRCEGGARARSWIARQCGALNWTQAYWLIAYDPNWIANRFWPNWSVFRAVGYMQTSQQSNYNRTNNNALSSSEQRLCCKQRGTERERERVRERRAATCMLSRQLSMEFNKIHLHRVLFSRALNSAQKGVFFLSSECNFTCVPFQQLIRTRR